MNKGVLLNGARLISNYPARITGDCNCRLINLNLLLIFVNFQMLLQIILVGLIRYLLFDIKQLNS